MGKKRAKLSDQVRRAASDCGATQKALARAAGIDKGALSRFVSGERGLMLENLDALADVLKLRIVADGPPDVLPAGRPGRPPKTPRKAGGK